MNFSYYLPTRLNFGFGAVEHLGKEASALGGSKVLVVTDRTMVKTGAAARVTAGLRGFEFEVLDTVEPEPRIEIAQSVAEEVRSGGYDLVIGVGGGSVMDMAKLATGFSTNPGPATAFVGNDHFGTPAIPGIMVPTTAGTGAELTMTSMVTVEGHKRWINSPFLLPSSALVDPELTMTMPKQVTAATGMDALCHNAEAYLSNLSNPITDAAALEGVALASSNLESAYADGGNRKVREAMSLAAMLGGMALHARMVYGHSVGYTIATRFNLPHGVSCGIALPYIISNYAIACAPLMRNLARAFGIAETPSDPLQLGRTIGERILEILGALGMPTSLEKLGVKEDDLPGLARECLTMYPRPNSPLVLDERAMLALYSDMWNGRLAS